MHKILGVIPARIGSTRLPRKPLADLVGKSLIQRTYESCQKAKLVTEFIVATDSLEINEHVRNFGGNVWITQREHLTGTSRLLEITEYFPNCIGYINTQGDHPILDAEHIDSLAIKLLYSGHSRPEIVTPIVQMTNWNEIQNPNVVKVVLNSAREALYFSRSPIPYVRDNQDRDWLLQQMYWKHLGLYGFNYLAIHILKKLESCALEKAESLEQLSWIYHQIRISCVEVKKDILAVDTYEDLAKVSALIQQKAGSI